MSTPDEALERYVAGYVTPPEWQSSDARGDPQLSGLRTLLGATVDQLGVPVTVWDVGMGAGALIPVVQDMVGKGQLSRYVGIDLEIGVSAVETTGIATGFLASDIAQYRRFKDWVSGANPLNVSGPLLVILRNVTHELSIIDFAALLRVLMEANADQVVLLLQDLLDLPVAELLQAPFRGGDLLRVFEESGFTIRTHSSDLGRSGTQWITLLAERRERISECDEAPLLERLLNIRREQLADLRQQAATRTPRTPEDRLALLKIQNSVFTLDLSTAAAAQRLSELQSLRLVGRPTGLRFVHWDEIIEGIDRFIAESSTRPSVIVGISRGGLPIAVALAHRYSNMPLAGIFKRYEPEVDHPFFVFAENADVRSEDRVRLFDVLAWPSIQSSGSSILVVDDVTTFGNTFEAAESLIRFRVGDSPEIRFFTFAADRKRLAAAKPGVFRRLHTVADVDNRSTWMVFPWERL